MAVEVPRKFSKDALPTAHTSDAKKKLKKRIDKDSPNKQLLDSVKKAFKKAVTAKEPVQKMQLRSLQQYLSGDFGDESLLDDEGDEIRVNFVKTLMRNIRARISDAAPAPVAVPRKPDDWHVANMHDATMKYILDANDWKHTLERVIFDCVVKGDGFTRNQWEPDMGEEGNVEIEYLDALRVFPGSSTRDLQDQGMFFVLHSEPLHKVVEKFPDAELEAAASSGAPFPHFGNKDFFFDNIPLSAFSERRFEKFENEGVKVLVAGSGGDKPEEFRQFDDNVNYVEAFLKYPKGHDLHSDFPNGRRVFFSNLTILADQKWEKEERLPYTHYPIETEGDSFWHNSLVSQLSSSQRVVNKLGNIAVDAAEKAANPPLLTPKNGGLDEQEYVSDMSDRVLYVNPIAAQATKHVEPPPFPSEALEVMQLYVKQTEQLAGVQDISQGRIPGSLQSGEAIDLLQEAAQTIIRHYIRNVTRGVRSLGESLSELIQTRFTSERVIRTGDKSHNDFVTINKKVEVERAKKELQQAANKQEATQAQRKIAMERIENQIDEQVDEAVAEVVINDPTLVPVDIRIASGGDKLSRAGRVKEAKEFFKAGAIDERELLRVANWDNMDEVLDRVEEKKLLAQRVDGLQERLDNLTSAVNEFVSQVDAETTAQLQAALQQQQQTR